MAYEQRDFGGGAGGGAYEGSGDRGGGGFGRGRGKRAVTDYGATMVHWMRNRQPRYKGGYQGEVERPSPSYIIDMLPPAARLHQPADSIPVRHLHSSLNKIKHPVNVVKWTPEGRRLLTGSSSGEFTLWNGTGFNFETIMQAHDVAIRAMSYSHSDDWLISADQDGLIKYWEPNFNNVKVIQGHADAIRDLAFSPTDSKFVTASDDSTLKIFDFAGGVEESSLTGHGWDAKSVDWHPTKGLLVSGSKDHLVKLWDPRTGRCLTTLHGHKNTITKTLFERVRGQCLATSARDQTARIFDLRMMRDVCLLKGHDKDIATLAWHPIHSSMLSTGGNDGSIHHYLLDEPNPPPGHALSVPPYESVDPSTAPAQTIYPAHRVPFAHEFAVWSLDWHPVGHILASGSNDRVTRFWTRARPGETEVFNDRYHIGDSAAEQIGTWDKRKHRDRRAEEEEQEAEDEAAGLVDQKMPLPPGIPGLLPGNITARLPGLSGAVPPPPPPFVQGGTVIDPQRFKEMLQNGVLPPPPGQFGALPPGFIPPPPPIGFAGVMPPPGMNNTNGTVMQENGTVRRRGPLPSQEESLQMEQMRGRFTQAR